MKFQFFLVLFLLLLTLSFCKNHEESTNVILTPPIISKKKDTIKIDYQLDVVDSTIVNTTEKKIDVLINNLKGFLGKKPENIKPIHFNKDYVFSNRVEVYNDNLLFEEQVLITPQHILCLDKPIKNIKNGKIKSSLLFEKKRIRFEFENSKGEIKFNRISCNDTDLNDVTLNYKNGFIKFKELINPCVFEYDLDKNGKSEIYIIGIRNCSQEFIILRVR